MWCCLHFRIICSNVLGYGELHMGHAIDGKASLPKNSCFPCIDHVSVLEDMFFESRLCFCLSKFYLIAH